MSNKYYLIMRFQGFSIFLNFILSISISFSVLPSLAQKITNPDSLSKNTFGWNQEEKEFGFAHFDEIFKTRKVSKGRKVHKLSEGTVVAAFSKGGQKENGSSSILVKAYFSFKITDA